MRTAAAASILRAAMRLPRICVTTILTVFCCAAEGAPEESDAPAATTRELQPLRLLSYNIKHGRGMDGKVDLQRIAEVISSWNPDLVALQEVDKNCKRSGEVDIAGRLGELLQMEPRFAKFMDFGGGEYGLAVLSRLPVTASIRHPLPEGAEPRCALEVQVRAAGWPVPVSFVCIHNDWTNGAIRGRQVAALLDAVASRKNPVILAGDFNGPRSDASMRALEAAGWTILPKDGEAAGWNTFPSVEPTTEIDFIVTRNIGSVVSTHRVVDERVASDHRPIFAALERPR